MNVPRATVAVLAVIGLAALQRERLVALLTSTTGTWVGSPAGVRGRSPGRAAVTDSDLLARALDAVDRDRVARRCAALRRHPVTDR